MQDWPPRPQLAIKRDALGALPSLEHGVRNTHRGSKPVRPTIGGAGTQGATYGL
jgi:hypothetical protein